MNQEQKNFHRQLVENAQILLKLSLGFSASRPQLGYYKMLASYKHVSRQDELALTKAEEGVGAGLFEHIATYTLATQIDTALAALYGTERFKQSEQDVQSAAWIARLIRNGFAHNPFAPEWQTYPECANKQYEVPSVIAIDTTGLDGKHVSPQDYGGPLALLRLSAYVLSKLEEDKDT